MYVYIYIYIHGSSPATSFTTVFHSQPMPSSASLTKLATPSQLGKKERKNFGASCLCGSLDFYDSHLFRKKTLCYLVFLPFCLGSVEFRLVEAFTVQ